MNLKLLSACCAAVLLFGCAVQKEWNVVNGSRSDGTVTLAYEYGLFETPQEDMAQGGQAAQTACTNWGYANATPMAATRQCEQANGYGNCVRWLVSRRYQCTGQPDAKSVVAVPLPLPAAPPVGSESPHTQDVKSL